MILSKYFDSKKALIFITCLYLFTCVIAQQTGDGPSVTGKITDADNNPLIGVNVYITGYSSTFTNDSGIFILKVPSAMATIQLAAKGYDYQEVPIKGRNDLSIKLNTLGSKNVFDEVKLPLDGKPQSNTVYATQILNNNDAISGSVEGPETFMQGKLAGVNMVMRSGMPGSGANIFIRGYNSFMLNNQPLVIVDGMIFENVNFGSPQISNSYENLLSLIDVRDIQSITLIKDATSVYGSKAANGVLLITTKHSTDAETKISFSTFGSLDLKPEEYPMLDAESYKSYLSEMLQSSGYSSDYVQAMPFYNDDVTSSSYYRFHNNTNWQKEVFDNSLSQNYHLSINGGDNIAKYNISMGFTNKGGVVKNTDFSRFNTRLNADIYFSKQLLVNANLGFSTISRSIFNDGISSLNPAYLSLIKEPFLSPHKRAMTGEIGSEIDDAYYFNNPVAFIEGNVPENRNNSFFGSVKANYKISDKLTVSSLAGINFNKIHDRYFIPNQGVVPEITNHILYRASESRVNRLLMLYNETKVNYQQSGAIHNFNVNAGFRLQSNSLSDIYGIGYNSGNDNNRSLGMSYKPYSIKGGSVGENNWASIFTSADYSFYKKYFVSAVLETDGSSKFGKEADGLSLFSSKFALFYSLGAAWLISSENFMAGLDYIDLLKLRISYGTTGNDGLGNYWNQRYYGTSSYYRESVLIPFNILNPEIQWETVKKLNLGLDIALFNQRVTASIDVYKNKTDNMVMVKSLPSYTGFENYLVNGGAMENSGFELQVNSRIFEKTFKWELGFSISKYKNKITELPEGEFTSYIAGAEVLTRVGQPVGVFYGYKSLGVFATDAEAVNYSMRKANGSAVQFHGGDIHFASSDNTINENDKQIIGDPNPDFIGSISNTFKWKRLALDALITFSVGNDVYNYQRAKLESMSGYENQTQAVLDRWRFDGQVTEMPKATFNDPMGNSRFSSRWIEDGSFMRLKTVTLSYDVPFKQSFFKNINIYLTGTNLVTLTKYIGYDPEFSMSSSPLEQGIDYGLVPQYKSILFGVKLGL